MDMPEITAGEAIAIKLKNIYYPDVKWSAKIAFEIGYKLRDLKRHTRPFYANLNEVQFLHKLNSYSAKDIEEVFLLNAGTEAACKENPPTAIGVLMEHSMALKASNSN